MVAIFENKLQEIFTFLSNNRDYNRHIQFQFFESSFSNRNNKKDKIISLLYFIAETQSQPSINKLAISYKKFHNDSIKYDSFKNFTKTFGCKKSSYKSLFETLNNEYSGFGPKTSALFTRMIYQIHNIKAYNKYKIWEDVPELTFDDELYLPVDSVIVIIFNKIFPNHQRRWTFNEINKQLNRLYKNYEIEVWDDLWFWGYISQKGSVKRDFVWNEEKYWSLKESNKDSKIISEIRNKSIEFLRILLQK